MRKQVNYKELYGEILIEPNKSDGKALFPGVYHTIDGLVEGTVIYATQARDTPELFLAVEKAEMAIISFLTKKWENKNLETLESQLEKLGFEQINNIENGGSDQETDNISTDT